MLIHTLLGLMLAGLGRIGSRTLSQTGTAVVQHGVRESTRLQGRSLATILLMPLLVAMTCGGWMVLEACALARSRRSIFACDRGRAVQLLAMLRDHPAGLGTRLLFKPGETQRDVRRLVGYLVLHRLIVVDRGTLWLSRRANRILMQIEAESSEPIDPTPLAEAA
jgi:hypothetical protein